MLKSRRRSSDTLVIDGSFYSTKLREEWYKKRGDDDDDDDDDNPDYAPAASDQLPLQLSPRHHSAITQPRDDQNRFPNSPYQLFCHNQRLQPVKDLGFGV